MRVEIGTYVNCKKKFGSLVYSGTKGYVEDITGIYGQWIHLSDGNNREDQCIINIENYQEISIMDELEIKIFKELGV